MRLTRSSNQEIGANGNNLMQYCQIKNSKNTERGAALLFTTLLVLVVISIISLGVAGILVRECKTRVFVNDSPLAYSAADSGAERILFKIYQNNATPTTSDSPLTFTLSNGASYTISVVSDDPLAIRIVGSIGEVSRAIRLSF